MTKEEGKGGGGDRRRIEKKKKIQNDEPNEEMSLSPKSSMSVRFASHFYLVFSGNGELPSRWEAL